MHHVSSFTSGESGGQGVPSAVAPSPFNLHITALHPELKRARPDSFNAAEPGSAFIQAGGGGRETSFNSRGPAAFGGGGSASGMHHSSSQQQLLLHANSQAQHLAGPGLGQPGALAASAGTPRATATPPPTPSAMSMRPAVNPAAVAVLTAAITRSDGIAPSAQASLLQLLGSLVSTDLSGVVSGDAGTTVQQPQQSGSPLKTSSGISTGHQLLAAAAAAGALQNDAEAAAAAALAQQHHVMAKAAADCGSGSFHKVTVPIMPSVGMPGPKPLPPSLAAGSRGAPSGSAQQQESAGAGTASSTLGAGGGVAGAPSTAFAAVKQDPGGPDDDEGATAAACDGDAAGADGVGPPRGRTFTRISSLKAGGGSLLAPAKSLCTYKTKALAAAAGAARVGAAGSTLRLVGTICRSSSGSLVDALLSEAARAESGLLTAGLPRSDSLPDMLPMASDESAAAAAAAAAATGDINAAVAGALRPGSPPAAAAPPPAEAPMAAQPTAHPDQPSAATAAGTAAAAAAALASLTPGTAASIWNSLKDLDLPSSLISIPSLSFLSDPNDLLSLSADDLKLLQSKLEQQSVQIMQQQQQQQQPQLEPPPAAAEARPSLTPFQGHRSLPGKQLLTEDSLLPSWGGSRGMARLPSATRRAAAALFSHDAAATAVADHDAAVAAAAAADGGGNTPLAASGLRPPQLLNHSHLLSTASQQQQQQQQQPRQQQYMPRADLRVSSFEIAAGLGYAALQQRQQQQQQQQQLYPGLHPHSMGQGLRQMKRQDTFDVLLRQVDQELLAEAGAKQYAALQFDTLGSAAPSGGMGAAAIPSPYAAVAAAGGPGGGGSMFDLSGWPQPQQQQQRGHGVFSTPNSFGGGVVGAESALQQQLAAAAAAASVGRGGAATDSQEVVRYSRVITCKTYLKRLNITQPMAEHLLPYHNLNVPAAKAAAGADEDDSPRGGKPASSYEMLFKDEVAVVDASGGRFRVQYEGVSCNSQKHLRLTSGWRDYIRAHGVEVGDTIVFERRGEERRVLYASIIKGDGPGGAREARAPSATGQKRKRASRAAVQRLD